MGRQWEDHEVHTLRDLYLVKRWTAPDIATELNRSKGSVRMKIVTLGLSS